MAKAKQKKNSNTYVECYILPVKTARLDAYQRFAEKSGDLWLAHGALAVTEYVADDAKSGVRTSFPQSVQLEPDETVVVALITFASRADCHRIKAAVMNDPAMSALFPDIPVDGSRMFWGGFTTLVER